MTFAYRHRKQILIIALCLSFLGSLFYFSLSKGLKTPKKNSTTKVILKKKEENKEEEKQKEGEKKILFQVDVKGAVLTPGIYEVEEGYRVIDAIRLAGGLLDISDTTVLNLSKKVKDEMVIIVYTKDEVERFRETKEQEAKVQEKCKEGLDGVLSNDACIMEGKEQEKISLNQATKEELMTLPGIGESKADAILKYREEHGGFQTLEELKEVSGIGESLYHQIQENLTL